jgi:methyl-accepting chemotaxis protein
MTKLRIGHRIAIIPLLLSILMLAVGLTGFFGMRSMGEAMDMIYSDRIEPMRDLKAISDAYAVTVVDAAHKVRAGTVTPAAAAEAMRQATRTIDERWKVYVATAMIPEEARLAKEAQAQFLPANEAVAQLQQLVAGGNSPALTSFIEKTMYPKIDPIVTTVSKLSDLQLVAAKQDHDTAEQEFRIMTVVVIITIVMAVFLGALSAYVLTRGITVPLGSMTAAMQELSKGKLDITIPTSRYQDEIGDMAIAMVIFKDNAIERHRLQQEEIQAAKARAERAQRIEMITSKFDNGVTGVLVTVSHAAEEMNGTASSLSASAEEASVQATTVSAAAEELHASIGEISRQMTVAKTIAGEADIESQRAAGTMQELSDTAQRISQVVTLITDIANQTNLLALNATIEAARAGEAGKGFAVVASEVKSLANQTAKATEDIAQQVNSVQTTTGAAVSAISNIAQTISRINEIATAIAAAVEEQGAATREISDNVAQVAQATSEVTQNIQGVNQAAQDTSQSAATVKQASQELSVQATNLRQIVQHFLTDVRAA